MDPNTLSSSGTSLGRSEEKEFFLSLSLSLSLGSFNKRIAYLDIVRWSGLTKMQAQQLILMGRLLIVMARL